MSTNKVLDFRFIRHLINVFLSKATASASYITSGSNGRVRIRPHQFIYPRVFRVKSVIRRRIRIVCPLLFILLLVLLPPVQIALPSVVFCRIFIFFFYFIQLVTYGLIILFEFTPIPFN